MITEKDKLIIQYNQRVIKLFSNMFQFRNFKFYYLNKHNLKQQKFVVLKVHLYHSDFILYFLSTRLAFLVNVFRELIIKHVMHKFIFIHQPIKISYYLLPICTCSILFSKFRYIQNSAFQHFCWSGTPRKHSSSSRNPCAIH